MMGLPLVPMAIEVYVPTEPAVSMVVFLGIYAIGNPVDILLPDDSDVPPELSSA